MLLTSMITPLMMTYHPMTWLDGIKTFNLHLVICWGGGVVKRYLVPNIDTSENITTNLPTLHLHCACKSIILRNIMVWDWEKCRRDVNNSDTFEGVTSRILTHEGVTFRTVTHRGMTLGTVNNMKERHWQKSPEKVWLVRRCYIQQAIQMVFPFLSCQMLVVRI
jgi:hypothetical protein